MSKIWEIWQQNLILRATPEDEALRKLEIAWGIKIPVFAKTTVVKYLQSPLVEY